MNERYLTNSTLAIKNADGTTLATVVVNEGSVRHYELMKEDYIIVKFGLVSPVEFKRGCYVDVPAFGRFVVTDKVTSSFNTTTGGYDYQLRFDAQYMRWKNKLIKFLPQIGCAEVSWSLTATAEVHLEQIVANVNALGQGAAAYKYNGTTAWEGAVSSEITADLAKAIDYDGITIIDALAALAEAFETEWYVVGNTIHIGKCQDNTAAALEVRLGVTSDSPLVDTSDTAETMSRNDSKTTQATRIYPYGSERNIPSKYRKDLVLDALSVTGNGTRFSDTTRKMQGGYFKTILEQSQKDITLTNLQTCNAGYAQGQKRIIVNDWSPFIVNIGSQQPPLWNSTASIGTLEKGVYNLDFTNFNLSVWVACNPTFQNYDFRSQFNAVLSLKFGRMVSGTWTATQTIYEHTFADGDWGEPLIGLDDDKLIGYQFNSYNYIGGILLPPVEISAQTTNCAVVLHFELQRNENVPAPSSAEDKLKRMSFIINTETRVATSSDYGEAHFTEPKPRIKAQFNARKVHYDNGVATSTDVTGLIFNPDLEQDETDAANVIQLPSGTTISQGDKVYIPDPQVTSEVPASYFSPKYNLDVQLTYGEDDDNVIKSGVVDNRLMLPEKDGQGNPLPPYVEVTGITDEEAVEQIVVFDDVFPSQVSKIGTIDASHTTTDKQENDDNTVTATTYPSYWITIDPQLNERQQPTDPLAAFNPKWALSGTLEITFQSGALNGFNFEVQFNPENAPLEGDNNSVNPDSQWWRIVRNEELNVPNEILMPAVGDEFVLTGFDASMINEAYITSAESRLLTAAQDYLTKISRDDSTYNCALMSDVAKAWLLADKIYVGRKVTLKNPAYFDDNGRESRIIGYELKLDILYDSPTLIVGEEAQYSRLGAIEDKINALAMNAAKLRKGETILGNSTKATGGGTGGNITLITTESDTPESDETAYSSLRTSQDYVSKKREEALSLPLSFYGGAVFGVYVQGESGTAIGSDGTIVTNMPLSAKNISASGNVTVGGDITADNITATGDINAVDITGSDLYATNNAYISNALSADSATITSTITANEVSATDIFGTNVNGAIVIGSTKVQGALIKGTTKVNTPLVEATTKVQTPRAEATEVITTSVKTPQFSDDPLAGYGFGIYNETEGQDTVAKAVVDYLTVRRKMVVATLEIWEYRSINGGLVLSPANGVIESVDAGDAAATVYKIYLKERNMFVAGDLIRCQRWDYEHYPNDPIRYYWVAVDYSNVNDCYIEVVKTEFNTGVTPQADDVLVLMGNTSDTTRQGFVLITIDGMSVYNGVNSKSYTGKLKSKFGDLSGLTFNGNSLSGYGLFGNSVYLSGKFLLENTTGGTTTYVDIDSELGTITSEISDINDDLTEMHSEIVQTAEEISMSVVESVVNGESENLYETPFAEFTLNRSQQSPGSQRFFNPLSAFAISEHLTHGEYYTLVMRVKLGTAWTGFQVAPEAYSYTSFALTAAEKGDWVTITRTFCQEVSSPTFQKVYIRLTGAEVTDPNTEAELQSIYLYKGDGVVGSLKRTGIDISTGQITLQADKVYFKNSAGSTPSILFDTTDGKILSKYIKAEELDTNHLIARDTNDFVIATVNADYDSNTGKWLPTNDGAYRIYYQSTNNTQNTAKKLEIKDVTINNYTTTMRMFDTNGVDILWELGADALTEGFTNRYLTTLRLVLGGTGGIDEETEAKTATTFKGDNYSINSNNSRIYGAVAGVYYDVYYTAERGTPTVADTTFYRDKYTVQETTQGSGVFTYTKTTITWIETYLV